MKHISRYLMTLTLILGFAGHFPAAQAKQSESLTFGIVPQQSASKLARVWLPILLHLEVQTGRTFRFATAKDIPTFEACLAKQAYDLAYMNPYHYVVFHKRAGYQAIARQKNKKLKGLLVTRKDSQVAGLHDLDGHSVAFPSPAAFGASVIPRAEMTRLNVQIDPAYVKSHDSVYRAVADGHQIAGGGVLRTWRTMPQNVRDQLRVFFETDAYTAHAIAIREEHVGSLSESVTAALIALQNPDAKILKDLGMKGFERAFDADWNDVRALNLSEKHTDIVKEDLDQCHSG